MTLFASMIVPAYNDGETFAHTLRGCLARFAPLPNCWWLTAKRPAGIVEGFSARNGSFVSMMPVRGASPNAAFSGGRINSVPNLVRRAAAATIRGMAAPVPAVRFGIVQPIGKSSIRKGSQFCETR